MKVEPNRPRSNSNSARTVAVLVGSLRGYHRRAILGIMQYQHIHRGWNIVTDPIHMQERPVAARFHGVDGAIVDHSRRKDVLPLIERGVPLVNLRTSDEIPEAGHVSNDATAIARMAISHFRDRQFEHIAYCEWQRSASNIRRQRFEEVVRGMDLSTHFFKSKSKTPGEDKDISQLSAWLQALPKPIGILAHNDIRGRIVIDTCNMGGIGVPDEVAVLGVDDELPYCMMCEPALSSVRVDAERIGFEAAAMLDRMMAGEVKATLPTLIPPTHVVERGSTRVLAVSDPIVVQAVQFIRDNACGGIQVDDVLQHVGVSRSALERRMKASMDRSPHDEIIRVRLERAHELLLTSDFSQADIAERTGFNHVENLSRVFRAKLGIRPGQVRAGRQK